MNTRYIVATLFFLSLSILGPFAFSRVSGGALTQEKIWMPRPGYAGREMHRETADEAITRLQRQVEKFQAEVASKSANQNEISEKKDTERLSLLLEGFRAALESTGDELASDRRYIADLIKGQKRRLIRSLG